MTWPTAPLSDLVDILSGFAFKSDQFNTDGDGMPLIRIRDVKSGTSQTFYKGAFQEKFVINDGDLLVGMDGEFNCAPWSGGRALLNQRVCRVAANETKLDQAYLNRFLPAALKQIEEKTNFVTVKHLSAKQIAEIAIPLPPLPEQRRIAAILDQADALRRLRRVSLAHLADLGQAIFEDRYGRLEGEASIENAVSDTLIGMVRNGSSFGLDFAVPYVRMDAITKDGAFLPDKVQRTDASNAEISRYALETGDILFNTRNSKELVGKTTIYRGTGPCTFNNNIMRIRMKPDWDPVFVEAFLRSKTGRQELEKRKSGTTSVWAVYWSQLKTLRIPKPSGEEQASFRAVVEAIWKKADLLREDLQKMEHLFAALQHRAFRGEL